MVSIAAFQAVDPGAIPGPRSFLKFLADGVVGYHARLTRARSQVRSSVRTIFVSMKKYPRQQSPESSVDVKPD